MIGRRGFLQTLAASLVGAATFDPIAKLWVPAAKAIDVVPVAALPELTPAAVEKATSLLIEQHAELNELAFRFARRMSERLDRHPSIALREVMYRHTGSTHLNGLVDIPGVGTKRFEPAGRAMAASNWGRALWNGPSHFDHLASELADKVVGMDAFAPISAELRPGEPFTEDVRIGVATDPETGLSVRVLRFEVDSMRGRGRTMTGVEMAGGRWARARDVDAPRPRYDGFYNWRD